MKTQFVAPLTLVAIAVGTLALAPAAAVAETTHLRRGLEADGDTPLEPLYPDDASSQRDLELFAARRSEDYALRMDEARLDAARLDAARLDAPEFRAAEEEQYRMAEVGEAPRDDELGARLDENVEMRRNEEVEFATNPFGVPTP